jgi:hypothetical protein
MLDEADASLDPFPPLSAKAFFFLSSTSSSLIGLSRRGAGEIGYGDYLFKITQE